MNRALALFLAALSTVVLASTALADSTPVGPLPPGPTTTLQVAPGKAFTVRVPAPTAESGRVWRIARGFDSRVIRQLGEGAAGSQVWLRFRAVAPGQTTVRLALTLGETRKAFAARSFRIVVR